MNLYITNLGKYNEGILKGDWISLPFDEDDWEEFLEEKVGINEMYEEYAIHDYECDLGIEIGEYSNVMKLNEIAEAMENLDDEEDVKKVKALMEWGAYSDIIDAIDNVDNYQLYEDINNDDELGTHYLIDSGNYDIPEDLEYYIDTEKWGRDYAINADGFFSEYGWIEGC